jgi:hypothetical protein
MTPGITSRQPTREFQVGAMQTIRVRHHSMRKTKQQHKKSMKAVLELGRQEKKSELEDDDRVDTIMHYLLEKAPKSCFNAAKKGVDMQMPLLFGRRILEELCCPLDSVVCSAREGNATNATSGENWENWGN